METDYRQIVEDLDANKVRDAIQRFGRARPSDLSSLAPILFDHDHEGASAFAFLVAAHQTLAGKPVQGATYSVRELQHPAIVDKALHWAAELAVILAAPVHERTAPMLACLNTLARNLWLTRKRKWSDRVAIGSADRRTMALKGRRRHVLRRNTA